MKWPMWINWVVLIVGILYLIKDIINWSDWWSLSWWTFLFLILGLGGLLGKKK
ncbi:MAG: hypothetical protein KKF46_01560 [Nanoarchaeota archaeon]|nr:hypothetical protein [Nanoarchaeota archaeon]MBU1321018.1 hypothetical protein [Nanoarchaeota archaeon]MBU2441681.1 hypothetical protein [Nanoarchaeota archaeon]